MNRLGIIGGGGSPGENLMKKRMLVGIVLSSLALGRAASVRAMTNPAAYDDAVGAINDAIVEKNSQVKLHEELRRLGFQLTSSPDSQSQGMYALIFKKGENEYLSVQVAEDHNLLINKKLVIKGFTTTNFLAATRNLDMIRTTIAQLDKDGWKVSK